ncbi:MAG: hypothetical protein ACPHRO_00105, partial [Nannocystaceae bacterium]
LGLARPPEFPVPRLEFGAPSQKTTEEKDVDMFGQEIPMEFEKNYAISVASDEAAANSVTVEVVGSGAKEISQGGQSTFVAIDQEVSGTIDVMAADGVPTASRLDILMTITFGEMVIEQNVEMDVRYSTN